MEQPLFKVCVGVAALILWKMRHSEGEAGESPRKATSAIANRWKRHVDLHANLSTSVCVLCVPRCSSLYVSQGVFR